MRKKQPQFLLFKSCKLKNDNREGQNKMDVTVITSIAGMIIGSVGLLISILNFRRDSLEALNMYFTQAREKDFVEGKKIIYNSSTQEIENMKNDFPKNVSDSIVEVINFFHHWGLMIKHHQLPKWLFCDKKTGITANGIAVVRTYNKLKPIIERYRQNNAKYAEYYEYLYKKIINHHPEYSEIN